MVPSSFLIAATVGLLGVALGVESGITRVFDRLLAAIHCFGLRCCLALFLLEELFDAVVDRLHDDGGDLNL